MKNKLNMLNVVVFFLLYVSSCKQSKIEFNDYFEKLVADSLHIKYKGYTYGYLRDNAYYIYFPDGLQVAFTKKENNVSVIRSTQIAGKEILIDETELKNKINNILQDFQKHQIILFESNEYSVMLYFDLKYFNSASLPKYQGKLKVKEKTKGALVYYFTNPKETDEVTIRIFEYYQPTPIKDGWYFFITN